MVTGFFCRTGRWFGMLVMAFVVLVFPLSAAELLWTGGGPLSARSFHDFSEAGGIQVAFLPPEQGGPAVRFDFQKVTAGSHFVRSDSISLPKGKDGAKRMIRFSGRAALHDAAFQRLQLKLMAGKRGGQYFYEPAIDLAGPGAASDGRFSQAWTLADDDIALNIFAVADGKGSGTLDLSDLKLEILPFDEALLFRSIPESGLLLYDLAAASSRFPDGNAPSMQITAAPRGVLVDFGAVGKPSKSLVFKEVSLPYVHPGTRLRVTAESRGVDFNGRRLELKPLMRNRDGEAYFVPPYPTMPHDGTFGKFSAEWPIDAKVAGVTFFLAADGDTTGKLELADFKIELLPSELAAMRSGFDFNVIPHDTGKLKVAPARADKFTGGDVTVSDENGKKLFALPLTAQGVEIKLAEPGFYRIKVAARYSDRAGVVVTDSSAVVAGRPLTDEVLARSRFGAVNLSGSRQLARSVNSRWEWNFTGLAGVSKTADGKISPAPEWRFHKPDFVDVIYTLGNLPAFLQPPNREKVAIWKPTDSVIYDKVIQEMARSRNFPRYFTVFNEPEGKWRGTLEEFVQWHRDTARAIKKVNHETKVLGPGLCSVNMPLIKKYDKAGLFRYLAGVNVHPYVDGTAPEDEFIAKVDEMEAYFKSTGRTKYPIFYTEFGWTTGRGGWQKPVDEATQMRYVARSLALLGTGNMTGCVYFTLFYRNVNPGEEGFSLIYPDGSPRPGLAALTAAFKHLGGAGRGKRLQLSPELYLAAYPAAQGRTLLAVWRKSGSEKLNLPVAVQSAFDVTGRPFAIDGAELTATPEVRYLYTDDPAWRKIAAATSLRTRPGELVTLGKDEKMLFSGAEFQQSADGRRRIAADAVPGRYLMLIAKAGKLVARPLIVEAQLEISDSHVVWPVDAANPEWRLDGILRGEESVLKSISARLDGRSCEIKLPSNIQRGEKFTASVELPSQPAKMPMRLELTSPAVNGRSTKRLFEVDYLTAKRGVASMTERKLAQDFGFAGNEPAPKRVDTSDCSATVAVAYDDAAFYVTVTVDDNDFHQLWRGQDIWQGDSIQLGIDVDGDKPVEANAQFGWNGHRVFEYGAAHDADGADTVWRYLAYDPILKENVREPEVGFEFGCDGTSAVYKLRFPWKTLGLKQAPAAGRVFGFSLIVNDVDLVSGKTGSRHGLRLFEGVHPEKDPRRFGKLFLR